MEFIFALTNYDDASFRSEVSVALEKRTEMISRKQHPKMWARTDKINAKPKAAEEVRQKRRRRYRVYGIVLLLLGLFLLIPGLMDPKELLVPLIAGVFGVAMGIAYLRYGIKPKKRKTTSFDKAATKLFLEYDKIPPYQVRFDNQKMHITETDAVDYSEIEDIFITEHLLTFIWNERITVLQQKDLISNSMGEFLSFMTEKSQDSFEMVRLA